MIELKPTTTTDEYTIGIMTGGEAQDYYQAAMCNDDVVTTGPRDPGPNDTCLAVLLRNGRPEVIIDEYAIARGPEILAEAMIEKAKHLEENAARWREIAAGVSVTKDWMSFDEYTRRRLELDAIRMFQLDDVIARHVRSMSTELLEKLVSGNRAQPMDDIPF